MTVTVLNLQFQSRTSTTTRYVKTQNASMKTPSNAATFAVVCAVFASILIAAAGKLLLTDLRTVDPAALQNIVSMCAKILLPFAAVLLVIVGAILWMGRKSIPVILAAALMAQTCHADERPTRANGEHKLLGIIIGCCIVVGGGWAGYKIWVWSDKHMPKVEKPPPKPPKVETNNIPTNGIPRKKLMGALVTTNTMWDISAHAIGPDWQDPSGQPFTLLFTNFVQTAFEPSFKGATTTEAIIGWLSSGWQEFVLYSNGRPVATNLSPRGAVAEMESGVAEPAQFYRVLVAP